MKSIEEAFADLYNEKINNAELFDSEDIIGISHYSFKAGVEFAQQWIPVKITPEWYSGCRLDILVKNETFKYPASVKIHTIYSDKDIQELKGMYTHWRPIELK